MRVHLEPRTPSPLIDEHERRWRATVGDCACAARHLRGIAISDSWPRPSRDGSHLLLDFPEAARRPEKAWLIFVLSFVSALCLVVTLGVITAPDRPRFAVDEQKFLNQIKSSGPSDAPAGDSSPWVQWPDDDELVREAHGTCRLLDDTHGKWELAFQQGTGANLIARYPYGQSLEMIADAALHLCPRWRLFAG